MIIQGGSPNRQSPYLFSKGHALLGRAANRSHLGLTLSLFFGSFEGDIP
jgi:hypothetical protein